MARRRRGRPTKRVNRAVGAEFFKVFMPTQSSHQLLIPPDFIKDFNKTLSEKVILKNVDGKKWYVDVKRARNGVFLKNGWQTFVDYHGLKFGEFLFFQYVGSYSFSVKILGTNGCKKETFKSKNIDAHVDSEEEEEADEEMHPKQTSRECALPQNEGSLLRGDGGTENSESSGEVNEVPKHVDSSEQPGSCKEFENSTQQMFPNCPCFTSPSRGPRKQILGMIPIPDEVMKEHNLQLGPEMILRNEKGKEWKVKINVDDNNHHHKSIGKGLYAFLVDNNVTSNQSCKFTFQSSTTINVQIIT